MTDANMMGDIKTMGGANSMAGTRMIPSDGRCPSLKYFALSGLFQRQALKGRNTLK